MRTAFSLQSVLAMAKLKLTVEKPRDADRHHPRAMAICISSMQFSAL
jgi:hypothetical protein